MTLQDWYEKGMDSKTYIDSMKTNKEELLSIYERFQVPKQDEERLEQLRSNNLHVIVLTEDWCGDAMVNVPILLRICEKAKIEARMLLRDQNLELMDQYLTDGTKRAIPIFIFIDESGNEYAVWGPRAPKVQQFVEDERAKLPPKDSPEFEDKQKEMYRAFKQRFTTDEDMWLHIYESIMERLLKQ